MFSVYALTRRINRSEFLPSLSRCLRKGIAVQLSDLRVSFVVCRECANTMKQCGTVRHREIIDDWERQTNQHEEELTRTGENDLIEIRN